MLSPTCSENDIEQRINTTLKSHRIAITASNLVILVPIEAQPNDLICVLPGGDLPIVLRKAGNTIQAREYHKGAFFAAVYSKMKVTPTEVPGIKEMNWGFQTLESLKGNERDDFHLVGEAYSQTGLSIYLFYSNTHTGSGMMFGEALPFKPTEDLQKFYLS